MVGLRGEDVGKRESEDEAGVFGLAVVGLDAEGGVVDRVGGGDVGESVAFCFPLSRLVILVDGVVEGMLGIVCSLNEAAHGFWWDVIDDGPAEEDVEEEEASDFVWSWLRRRGMGFWEKRGMVMARLPGVGSMVKPGSEAR
jgi:hypothetical protein